MSVDVASDGTMFLLDLQQQRVLVFDRVGNFVRQFGRKGRGPGEFQSPYRLVLSDDSVYVFDMSLGRIAGFDKQGRPGKTALLPFGSLAQPFLARRTGGGLFLSVAPIDSLHAGGPVVYEFNGNLEVVGRFGKVVIPDSSDWKYLASGPLTRNEDGTIWFAPITGYQLIRRYSANGRLLSTITNPRRIVPSKDPFRQEEIQGKRAQIHFNTQQPLLIGMDADSKGRVWTIIRDVTTKLTYVDVYDAAGNSIMSFSVPVSYGLIKVDRNGMFYGVTTRNGFPEMFRYKVETTPKEAGKCPKLW